MGTNDRIETIYGIYSGTLAEPRFHYVGKTVADLQAYWKHTHQRNYHNGIEKSLYEYMRFNGGIEAFQIVALDRTDSGLTEADWVKALTLEGHNLLNDNKGNSKVAAAPSRSKTLFRELNRKAAQTLEENERKARLMNEAQQLTKAQIVQQRIRGKTPTLEEVLACQFRPCEPMLLAAWAEKADECEYTKIGDFSVFIARRKKEYACVLRHRSGKEIDFGARWNMRGKDRERVLFETLDAAASEPRLEFWRTGPRP